MNTAFTTLLLLIMNAAIRAQALDLQADLLRAITNKNYEAPTQNQLTRARELFSQTFKGARSAAELKTNWDALGFEFQEVKANGELFWLIREPPATQSGRGWYLFRTNQQCQVALEAPHARNDIRTGLIALRFFYAGKARVLGASTITRHRADMGHLDRTFFQMFTLAFADACPDGMVVQLHGFESENHSSTTTDIVASAGTRSPQPWLTRLVDDLGASTHLRVLAYPRDTKVLGAVSNAQGQALQRSGRCRFLHLEMTAQLRERLTHDGELCRATMSCLSHSQAQ